ncbi:MULTISPECIES: TonB-dependent receptor [unclassified Lysobacter]|uniref:TonB-dependent receptor n=1 Tax=unclassified Lysobacter TaxID=2635362 RepID=UPI001C23613C|nr:TonB-dependent receptor [Lysobacter sp. MMG2]MBU8975990.1 TonB-dependent receptor [Lysobacter sp. MMG2]
MQFQRAAKKTPVTLLAASIGLALQLSAVSALAQEAAAPAAAPAAAQSTDQPTELDTVTVTGFRGALEKALDKKRSEIGVVDAIVAEDIADFPDLNLAESLQRIPGVSIARDAGEGRQISVRGLDSQFTRVRINGMEALTTTGGTDSSGGANRGRGFDFNVFASELFNSITVRKTSSAEIEEGALGATVDLQTARPFDYDGFTFVTGAQLGYNDLASDLDPRATMLISNTWADNKFGALLSVAYTKRRLVEEGHSTVRWDNGPSNGTTGATGSGGFNGCPTAARPTNTSPFPAACSASVFHPRIPRYGVLEHEQERLGVTASLQFDPTDSTSLGLDMMYADLDATRTENFLNGLSFSRGGAAGKAQSRVLEGAVDGRGNLVYGRFDDVDVRSEARYDELETKFTQFNFYGDHKLTEDFSLNFEAGRAKSEFSNPIQTTITIDRLNADGYVYDYRGDNRLPVITNGFDVNDPSQWAFINGTTAVPGSEIRLRPQYADNTIDNAQLGFAWQLTDAVRLKGGGQYKEYTFDSREERRASEVLVPALPAGVTLADLTRQIGLEDISGVGDSTWLIPDIDAFNRVFNIYSDSGMFAVSDQVAAVLGNNRSVEEKDHGFWLQADFTTQIGSLPLSGNVGVRQVETKQTSTGYSTVGTGAAQLTTVRRSYDDTLPSFNLVLDVTPDFLIRVAGAKVMARPGLGNLTPGVTVNVSGGNRVVNGGNPMLDPFRATTGDLSFEWYFAEESLLALGLFYKDIDSFVLTSRETRPYSSSGLPASLLEGTTATVNDDFQFNVPINSKGGPLKGLEFTYQQPFVFLPGFWSDFGVQLNYTYVDSKIQYVTATGAPSLRTDLTGLSKNAYNATLYYEGPKFGARVSAAYRDDFLTTVPGRNNNDVEGTAETLTIDMSASYKINEHFEITLEGLNLTDEYQDQWVDSIGDRASVYHHTGRQYFLGARYKF